MKKSICCFTGHSKISAKDDVYEKLKSIIVKLIKEKNVCEFFVGNYGDFDALSAKAVREIKKDFSDVKLILVIPYLTAEIENNKEYFYSHFDAILIADIPENTPERYRIIKCNQYMTDKSEYIVTYIRYSTGGAIKTYQYAKRKNKNILCL